MSERPGYNPEQESSEPEFSKELLGELEHMEVGSTFKGVHKDHPELVIRRLKTEVTDRRQPRSEYRPQLSPEELEARYSSYHEFQKYGLEVLPFKVFEHEGETHIATKKVHGVRLTEAIENNPQELTPKTEEVFLGLMRYFQDTREKPEGVFPFDMTIEQFMYGQYQGDNGQDRVLYVDIDPDDEAFEDVVNLKDPRRWIEELSTIGRDILKVEEVGGVKLNAARGELNNLFEEVKGDESAEAEMRQKADEAIGSLEYMTSEEFDENYL